VSLVALPVFAINAIPAGLHPALNWKDFVGIGVWVAGFATEVIADRQKSQWRKEKDDKKHSEEWISRGLWAKSRHPNYFGFNPLRCGLLFLFRGECDLDRDISCICTCSQFHGTNIPSLVWICNDCFPIIHYLYSHQSIALSFCVANSRSLEYRRLSG